jgi:hypothetical protein
MIMMCTSWDGCYRPTKRRVVTTDPNFEVWVCTYQLDNKWYCFVSAQQAVENKIEKSIGVQNG